MTEEIKKLIELRINAGVIDNRSNYALFNEGMRKGSEIAREIILSKWQEAERWRNAEEELPPLGEEVLFFHEDWIDEDFNPKGVRIGFRLDDDYVTAHYWSHQDCYMTISHSECDNNAAFSDKTKKSIEPHKWKPIS